MSSPQVFPRALHVFLLLMTVASLSYAADTIDLSNAVVTADDDSPIVATARRTLIEEVAKRTGVTLASTATLAGDGNPVIALCRVGHVPKWLGDSSVVASVPPKAEGFAIGVNVETPSKIVVLAGRDERGVLFAVGRLLLQLKMTKHQICLPADYRVSTAPRYPMRGHQIGFRSLSHCYDAWTPDTYEQYMRELALFGANSFETTPFRDPDEKDGPLAKVTQGQMAAAWSRICAEYGFDFWLFAGAQGGTGKSPEEMDRSMEAGLKTLRAIPHLDHLYMTGGDGDSPHRRPDLMLEWVGGFAAEARKIHPGLGIWVSNQGFDPEQNNWYFGYLQREQPRWLTGVVDGAWARILADEQRARTPKQYPIRRYPDIGHCVRGQYPVPGWDRALAGTLGREPFAPRPRDHARIHNLFAEYADGFVTYSDGVGDDVNKVVWTALGWDPDRSLDDIMLDYARFFFGWDIAERVREGLYGLERDFDGSLAENAGVEKTFQLWKSLEAGADEALLANWRFQECLLRAYYDHYTRLRLIKANDIEAHVCTALRRAPEVGVEQAIQEARTILAQPDQDERTEPLKARIRELGAQLFESIGAQLDVGTYKAKTSERGAVLEFLDTPLNNKQWIESEFEAILAGSPSSSMPEVPAPGDIRLQRVARVANWEDPGPGGFYDDLGQPWRQPHLVKPRPLWDDPAGITTPREDHTFDRGEKYRLSWLDVSEALYQTPLVLRYEGLDPQASYRVRVTYLGRYKATVRLVADDQYEVHDGFGHTVAGARYPARPDETEGAPSVAQEKDTRPPVVMPLEFPVPGKATEDGKLELKWERLAGRGIQVAEVWLLKD